MKRRLSLLAALLLIAALPTPATSLAPVLRASDWLGGRATSSGLRGKVVLVDFFSVDCDSCRSLVPKLRSLYAADRRKGLVIVGIHTPETPPEKQRNYVVANLQQQGIVWPVALDNAFHLWDAYGVNAWPTQLFFDRHGRLRDTIVGDSHDDGVRREVEALLAER